MKNLKTIITVIAISLATTFTTSATEGTPSDDKKTLRTEIVSLLGKKLPLEIDKSSTAQISFIVNNKNEVIVVSVDSKHSEFNSYVKSKLNYKKLDTKNIKKGEVYKMPIQLKRS